MRPILHILIPLLGSLPSCGEEQAAGERPPARERQETEGRPEAGERLLEVDGLVVRFGDLDPFVAYLDALYPRYSYKTKLGTALDHHFLPVLLARRAFPDRRAELRRRAESLCQVADNVHELVERGKDLGGRRSEEPLPRKAVELPVAAYVFEPTRIGRVSEPLEVAQGWKVVAAHDLIRSSLVADDRADIFQVPFFTHDMETFRNWLASEKERVSGKVTYVHPDFTDVLPNWLKAR